MVLRPSKDVTTIDDVSGYMRHDGERCRDVEERSELGVAEDLTLGRSHLYKAAPTLIM